MRRRICDAQGRNVCMIWGGSFQSGRRWSLAALAALVSGQESYGGLSHLKLALFCTRSKALCESSRRGQLAIRARCCISVKCEYHPMAPNLQRSALIVRRPFKESYTLCDRQCWTANKNTLSASDAVSAKLQRRCNRTR